jgi:hypothetical protein
MVAEGDSGTEAEGGSGTRVKVAKETRGLDEGSL